MRAPEFLSASNRRVGLLSRPFGGHVFAVLRHHSASAKDCTGTANHAERPLSVLGTPHANKRVCRTTYPLFRRNHVCWIEFAKNSR